MRDKTHPGIIFVDDFLLNKEGTPSETGGFGNDLVQNFPGTNRFTFMLRVVEQISLEIRPRGCIIMLGIHIYLYRTRAWYNNTKQGDKKRRLIRGTRLDLQEC